MTGRFTGPSAAILLTPPALTRLMASPTGLRWVTVGLETPLGSAEAIRAGAHLTAFLLREQQMAEDEPEAAREP